MRGSLCKDICGVLVSSVTTRARRVGLSLCGKKQAVQLVAKALCCLPWTMWSEWHMADRVLKAHITRRLGEHRVL